MNLLQRYKEFINQHHLFAQNDSLLIGVSGGLDSVALCHLCKEAGFHFSIAHGNFNLRGEESQRDETFVQALATALAVPFFVKQFPTKSYAEENKISIQVAARELRYAWFEELLHQQASTTFLLTAHHRDDNVETVLMNLSKGTGINGLRGILPKHGKIIRPLLFASRQNILDYAAERKLQWVEDSSNSEIKYTRNYFRHHIIPAIEKIYPQAKENMAATIERMSEAAQLYQQSIEQHKKKLLEKKGAEVHIPVLKLLKAVPLRTIIYEIIREYGFGSAQVEDAIQLLHSESGKYLLSSTHQLIRNRGWLIIAPLSKGEQSVIVIEHPDENVSFIHGTIQIKKVAAEAVKFSETKETIFVDAATIRFPLLLRQWKAGDYFYPLGMKKKKKLARFFIDIKLSKTDKEAVWIVESQRRIVWVVGYRLDDRFKMNAGTKDVLRLTLQRTS